jgi:serine/threonine-protein kinase
VSYSSEKSGFWNPFWRAADGGDQEQPIITDNSVLVPIHWSPDDRKLLLYRDSQETNSDLMIFDVADKKLTEFVATPAIEQSGIFSPDGKWVAYHSDESGHFEIYVRSVSGPDGRWQVSTNGGWKPMWKDQKEILYSEGNKVMRAPVQTTASFSTGTPEQLFEGRYPQLDVTSDHQRFIVTVPKEKENRDHVNVIVNWFEEVRKRAPLTAKH